MKQILDCYLEHNQADAKVYEYLLNCLNSGSNRVSHSLITQNLRIDDSWVREVEDAMHSIEKIVSHPRSSIEESREIVPVERAKRINSLSVRHLASHTDMIRNVDSRTGEVVPSRIMTSTSELTITIYENRFVYTLISRLETFLFEKYNEIKKRIHTVDTTVMGIKSNFDIGKTQAECEIKMRLVSKNKEVASQQENEKLLNRIEVLLGRVRGYKNTEFAKLCGKTKPVHPPIMKTNLLVKSVEYSKCYKLWLFLSSYKLTGYSVTVSEKQLPIDGEYYDDLASVVSSGIMTVIEDDKHRAELFGSLPSHKHKARNYRVLNTVEYDPYAPEASERSQGDLVNQFYYDKIKELLEGEELKEATDIENVSEINVNFKKLYKTLSKINDSFCSDILDLKSHVRNGTSIAKKREYLNEQTRILKRQETYLKAKTEEYESLVKKTEALRDKVAVLNEQIEDAKKKQADALKKKREKKK